MDDTTNTHSNGSPSARTAAQKRARTEDPRLGSVRARRGWVEEMRAKAEGGDGEAMYWLGVCYQSGTPDLTSDEAQAREWFERSAATRNPNGMAAFGVYLLNGIGGYQENAFGLVNVTAAAHLGSDRGAYLLGGSFFRGLHGLPKDPLWARFWLKKVVDGECKEKLLSDRDIAKAAKWLRELDQEEVRIQLAARQVRTQLAAELRRARRS